jgi:uncharacterized protein (DUF302 family)
MSEQDTPQAPRPRRWPVFLLGLVLGIAITGLAVVLAMPGMMIERYESRLGLAETVAAIEEKLEAEGWSSPGTMNLNKSMAKHGVDFAPQVRLVKLCKAPYAKEVLTDARHVACLMPCTLAVYEGDDGTVYISKMNTGLMGKLSGGTVARVMGGKVGPEERKILEGIVRK